jgi:hypothetical protein
MRRRWPTIRAIMSKPIDVLLCEYEGLGGRHQLRAVLDELTLTYTIVERRHGGQTQELRRHVSTLQDARRWANRHAPHAAEPNSHAAISSTAVVVCDDGAPFRSGHSRKRSGRRG